MSAISTVPMDKAEASALTDRIRQHIDAAWSDITRAHQGEAWKALGYSSWEAYVKAEFDMSRRRSYQLLDQGRVISALASAVGEGVQHVAQVTARDVAAVKNDLPAVTAEIRTRVEQGEEPQAAVAQVVAEKRAEREAKPSRLPEIARRFSEPSGDSEQRQTSRLLEAWDAASSNARRSFMAVAKLALVSQPNSYAAAKGGE